MQCILKVTVHLKRKKAEIRTRMKALQLLEIKSDQFVLKRLVDLMNFIVDTIMAGLVTSVKV